MGKCEISWRFNFIFGGREARPVTSIEPSMTNHVNSRIVEGKITFFMCVCRAVSTTNYFRKTGSHPKWEAPKLRYVKFKKKQKITSKLSLNERKTNNEPVSHTDIPTNDIFHEKGFLLVDLFTPSFNCSH